MKSTKKIKQAMVEMYKQRGRWEVEKSKAEGKPMMAVGYATPFVKYLPGLGFSINGVEWRYTTEYIVDHFLKMAADYELQADLLEATNALADEHDAANDIPF